MKAIYSGFAQFSILILTACTISLYAQDQCIPVGWATQNGGTTGGGTATPVTVTTLSALQTQANSSGAKVIYVSGTMGAGVGTRVRVSSNKTIFGLPGATLNGGFDIDDASNVIIRNMIIKGPGAVDVDGVDCMTIDNSTNVWIDHCDLSDGQDGNMDIVNGSNYITVTWTKFHYTNASTGHQFSNLIGNSDSKTSDRGKLKVTLMFNYWTEGCVERMPRVRFGQVHVVNNLFDSPDANHGVRAGIEADLRIERNAFIGINKPIDLYDNNFTAVTAANNLFSGTSGNTSGSGTAFAPPYTLSAIPAASVEATVKPCVGATLTTPSVCPCGTALPVELISFEAKQEGMDYHLRWMILENEKVQSIELEYSGDGSSFSRLEELKNTEGYFLLSASRIQSIGEKIIYVRLKVVEGNGSVHYSAIEMIQQQEALYVYPNPFSGQVYLAGGKGKVLTIYTAEGSRIYVGTVPDQEVMDFSILPSGIYFFVLEDEGDVVYKKTLIRQ